LFIDDINIPIPEKHGAQPPIEWLRNYIDHGFAYKEYIFTIILNNNFLLNFFE